MFQRSPLTRQPAWLAIQVPINCTITSKYNNLQLTGWTKLVHSVQSVCYIIQYNHFQEQQLTTQRLTQASHLHHGAGLPLEKDSHLQYHQTKPPLAGDNQPSLPGARQPHCFVTDNLESSTRCRPTTWKRTWDWGSILPSPIDCWTLSRHQLLWTPQIDHNAFHCTGIISLIVKILTCKWQTGWFSLDMLQMFYPLLLSAPSWMKVPATISPWWPRQGQTLTRR